MLCFFLFLFLFSLSVHPSSLYLLSDEWRSRGELKNLKKPKKTSKNSTHRGSRGGSDDYGGGCGGDDSGGGDNDNDSRRRRGRGCDRGCVEEARRGERCLEAAEQRRVGVLI
jgi:hypothetical protein